MTEKQIYDTILEPLWDNSKSGTQLDLLSAPQRNILYIENFENQLHSSYIGDVFYNGGGAMAYGVLEALKAVGSVINTKLMQDAIAVFPLHPIPDHTDCRDIMDELPEDIANQWQELTTIQRKNEENIFDLKIAYIKRHPGDFDLSLLSGAKAEIPMSGNGEAVHYYLIEPEYDDEFIIDDDPFEPLEGCTLHSGIQHDFPKITVSTNRKDFPDAFLSTRTGSWVIDGKFGKRFI